MTASTSARATRRRDGMRLSATVEAAVTVFTGTLVALLPTGNAVPAGTATAGPAVGVAQETINGDGVQLIDIERGFAYQFANSAAGDEITKAAIGSTCYVVDDQTVALTDNTGTRQAAGQILDVDAAGVWVLVG